MSRWSSTQIQLVAAGLGLLAAALVWVGDRADAALAASRSTGLATLLQTKADHVSTWMAGRRELASLIARQPELVQALGDIATEPTGLCTHSDAIQAALRIAARRVFGTDWTGDLRVAVPHNAQSLSLRHRICLPPQRDDAQAFWLHAPVTDVGGRALGSVGIAQDLRTQIDALLSADASDGRRFFAFDALGHPLGSAGASPGFALLAGEAVRARQEVASADLAGVHMRPLGEGDQATVGAWRWIDQGHIGLGVEASALRLLGMARPVHRLAEGIGLLALALLALGAWRARHDIAADGTPRRIGAYRIRARLGDGATSVVYLGEHETMERLAAVKVLKPQVGDERSTERFRREVRVASQLTHPGFPRLYDHGHMAGVGHWCAMEFLPGDTVQTLVERDGPQPVARVLLLMADVCDALAHAHGLGILHRDIKPHNLIVGPDAQGRISCRVLDFGLVKQMAEGGPSGLTLGVKLLGTLAYMAPERLRDPGRLDPRSDLHAVAGVAFFMLTGRNPFEVDDAAVDRQARVMHRLLTEPAPSARALRPSIPADVDALLMQCLDPLPEARLPDAAALAQALRGLAQAHAASGEGLAPSAPAPRGTGEPLADSPPFSPAPA